MSKSEEISRFINQLSFDLKAEMLVAVLMEQHSGIPEFSAFFEGQHKRDWSRDIDCSKVVTLETGDELLYIHLNRDGIYDLLPETLFHGMHSDESWTGEEMAKESMKLREEEREARLFFMPFENELFLSAVHLSITENQLCRNIYNELLTGMIPQFWKIADDLPVKHVTKMKKLLPEAYRLCGDIDLTVQCLEYILNEKVNLISSTKAPYYISEGIAGSGFPYSPVLGSDFVLGSSTGGFFSSLTFRIGPVENDENIHLIKNGSMDRFLECFYSYFIPLEFDASTEYIFSHEDGILTLLGEEHRSSSYLSFNSVIL